MLDSVSDNFLIVDTAVGCDFTKHHDLAEGPVERGKNEPEECRAYHTSLGSCLASDFGPWVLGQAGTAR